MSKQPSPDFEAQVAEWLAVEQIPSSSRSGQDDSKLPDPADIIDGAFTSIGGGWNPGASTGRSGGSERLEEIARGAAGADGALVPSFADRSDRGIPTLPKSDPMLMFLAGAIYFGIVGGLLAWGMDAGIMWQVIAGLGGALLGGAWSLFWNAVFSEQDSERRRVFRRVTEDLGESGGTWDRASEVMAAERGLQGFEVCVLVIGCALLGAALGVPTAGVGYKMTHGVIGLAVGTLAGLVLGGIRYSIRLTLVALDIRLIKTLGPIAGRAVGGALGGGCLGWVLWSRWSPGDGHSMIGAVIGGLIFVLLVAVIGGQSSSRPTKGRGKASAVLSDSDWLG